MAYNPAVAGVTVNKALAVAVAAPTDSRSLFFDEVNLIWRPYVSSAEVLAYLNTPEKRFGNFPIIINTGGTLSGGIITGGTNAEWWFKDGVADGNLVLKTSGGTGGGSTIKQYDI
jgi:hypothetical protein